MLTRFSLLKTLLLCFIVELRLFLFIQQGREAPDMSREFLGHHFLQSSGGQGGGRWLRNGGFSLFLWTVAAEMASFFASKSRDPFSLGLSFPRLSLF